MTQTPVDDDADATMVSALMVTFGAPERLAMQRQSIADYCRQGHPQRELVIIAGGGDADCLVALAAHVAALARPDIRLIDAPNDASLGAKRNISLDAAQGEVICQWDDDDRHHPQRIARQLAALHAADGRAVLLREVMQYFPAERLLYCINLHATEPRCMPGTLMCRRAAPIRYPETGDERALGEDTNVVRQLQAIDGVAIVGDAAHLYVYVTHGANSWPGSHHRMLADRLAVSRGILQRREAALRAGLGAFDFGDEAVTVQGYNGPAFTLSAAT